MSLPTPSFECLAGHHRRRMLGALCGCIVLPACATGPTPPRMTPPPTACAAEAGAITAITVERDCSRWPRGARES